MVVIAPPVVYWVVLSLSTFVANMLVTLFMYAAVRGFASKKLLGRSMSSILGFGFGMVAKFIIALVASLGALLLIAPITLVELIIASLLSFFLALLFSFIAGYREFRISDKKTKELMYMVLFAVLVALLTFVSAYFSLQTQVIVVGQNVYSPQQAPVMSGYAESMAAPLREQKKAEAAGAPRTQCATINIIPQSDDPCIVTSSGQTQTFNPKAGCVIGEGLLQQRVYCPVSVTVCDDYATGGSCK